MDQAYSDKKKILLCLSVLLLVCFLIIANPFLYFFLNDDFIHIPLAANGDFIQGSFYRPLSNLSIWLDYKLWGFNAAGYHLSNILIHLVNTLLIFLVGRKIFSLNSDARSSSLKSVLSALLFLIYAYHSEPVFWIIGRGGSLAALFFLLAFLFYLKSWSGSVYYYILSLLLFLAGLFAYEIIWCYPAVVAIFTIRFSSERKQGPRIAGVVIVFVLFLLFKFFFTGSLSGSYELGALKNFRLVNLFYNFNTLFARSFLPPMKNSVLFLTLYLSLLLSLFAALIKFRKQSKVLIVLFSCVGLCVLPVVSLGVDTHDSESERFIYLATAFAIFFIVELLFQFKKFVVAIACIFLLVFHSYELAKAAGTYKFSGMVTRKSLECISVSRKDTIIAINVPTQYQGALIFRIGLPEALEWFKGANDSNVYIQNDKEILQKFPDLVCKSVKTNITLPKDLFNVSDSTRLHLRPNRIILKWEGDSLLISREFL